MDIPCGTGRLIPLFERYGHQVWGADISADMLAMIPPSSLELPALRDLALVEAEHLPFVDGSFDYVVSLRFFHLELPVTVAETILHEFSRIACKGIVLHGPLEEWKLLPRVADSIIEICTSGWGVPIVLAKRTRRAMQLIQNRLRPGRGGSSGENTIVGQRGFSCTPKELERVIGQEGFNVTASYGAISSFSTKRIHMLDKSTVPPF